MRVVSSDKAEPSRAELFLGNRPVGLELVEEGEATVDPTVLTDCPETASRYWQAQVEAQQERRRLWGQYDLRVVPPLRCLPTCRCRFKQLLEIAHLQLMCGLFAGGLKEDLTIL